jgi:hypothetical protein
MSVTSSSPVHTKMLLKLDVLSSTLKMQARSSPETLTPVYPTEQRYTAVRNWNLTDNDTRIMCFSLRNKESMLRGTVYEVS